MSRVAKAPVKLPAGVEASFANDTVTIKGSKGSLTQVIHNTVEVSTEDNQVTFKPVNDGAWPMAGTIRALVNNMVVGVTDGFVKKITVSWGWIQS